MSLQLSPEEIASWNARRPAHARGVVCHAPVKSMYIGFRGNVSACCYNKTYAIGKYPDQSLEEIWLGERNQALSRALREGDLSLGCHGCHALIQARNFAALPAKNFDDLEKNSQGFPTKIDFELSNECNLECIMCRGEFSSAIRRNREKLPPLENPYGPEFLKQLEAFIPHLKWSHFLGGEPFMIPLYLDIWEKMMELNPNIRISIQTNATILSDRIKNILESMQFDISLSIDGVSKETYEAIRVNGKWDKVRENIRYFEEYTQRKGTHLSLSYCPLVQNRHEYPETLAFANKIGARIFFNTVTYPRETSLTSLSAEEMEKLVANLRHYQPASNTSLERENKRAWEDFVRHVGKWAAEAQSQNGFQPANFAEYMDGLEAFLQQDERYRERVQEVSADIQGKLEYLLERAAQKQKMEIAEQKLLEVKYQDVADAVPMVDREKLLELFQTFMMSEI